MRERRRKVIKARYLLLAVLLPAFPVTLNCMSPALPLQGAIERVISGSLMLFAALFSAAPFLGRLWCGWACPGGALQDLVASVNGRKPARGADYVKIRDPGSLAWNHYFFRQSRRACQVQLSLFDGKGVSADEPFEFIIYFFVSALLMIIALAVGKRGAYHCGDVRKNVPARGSFIQVREENGGSIMKAAAVWSCSSGACHIMP